MNSLAAPAGTPDHERLHFVFQPIVDMARGEIFGYEAFMRSTAGTEPEELLACARLGGRMTELEHAACLGAIAAFGRLRLPGRLFLNLSAPAIGAFAEAGAAALFAAAAAAAIAPARLVLELTEHERVTEPERLQAALAVFQAQGVGLALDDFGDGRSSLRLWLQLRPQLVKLDKYFAHDIHRDSRKVEALRAILDLAARLGAPVVAEGIEDAAELAVLRDLGCAFAQGYFLGRPAAAPVPQLAAAAAAVLASTKIAMLPHTAPPPELADTVDRLRIDAPAVPPTAPNEALRGLFNRHPEFHAVAVVDDGQPLGLIVRRSFLDRYAHPYHHELFGRRPCTLFMSAPPFRIERTTPITALVGMLAGEDQRYLHEGFIITDNGRYAGIATGESLVRAVTERRIEAARHANPLTLLPGNIPITEHIRRLLQAGTRFAACYFDLNHFKPYNDLYGYWRGDEMIKLAAAAVCRHADPAQDFVGHVGGDDFVALFQSEDWHARCERILADFNTAARSLFDAAELARGGFESEDRRGFRAFFPLTTIAVGAVAVARGHYRSPEEVASAAAAAKKRAKQCGGFHVQAAAPDCACCSAELAEETP